jgi:hypothetical protein
VPVRSEEFSEESEAAAQFRLPRLNEAFGLGALPWTELWRARTRLAAPDGKTCRAWSRVCHDSSGPGRMSCTERCRHEHARPGALRSASACQVCSADA